MATVTAHGGRRAGEPRHRLRHHHLSGQPGADVHEGWADGISSLTEAHSAAQLLEEEVREAPGTTKVRAWG